MQALANAGFKREQMRYLVADAAGGFLDSLKSVFTGLSPEEESLVSNLTDMGLSTEEAQYFSDEYARGSVILAIKTQGDEEIVLNILYEYGAYNAKERARFGGVMASPNRPVSSTGPDEYTAPVYQAAMSPEAVPSQPQGTETHSTQDYQQHEATANSYIDASFPQSQPASPGYNSQAYSVETASRENATLSPEETSDNRAEPFPQEVVNSPVQLLAQIETTKQQLEEARSQLEDAKQHESQLTTARLQLQELQAELQATQAELQQTRQRISG
jgi:hypothetical protein